MSEELAPYEPPRVRGLKSELRQAEQARDTHKADYDEALARVVKLRNDIREEEART